MEKLFKKYKKEENNNFNNILDYKYKNIIHQSLKSDYYEKVVKQLSKIEKKIKYIKKDLYNYIIKDKNFIKICNNIMTNIKNKEMGNISKEEFKKIKDKYFKKIMGTQIYPKKWFMLFLIKITKIKR